MIPRGACPPHSWNSIKRLYHKLVYNIKVPKIDIPPFCVTFEICILDISECPSSISHCGHANGCASEGRMHYGLMLAKVSRRFGLPTLRQAGTNATCALVKIKTLDTKYQAPRVILKF